MIMYSQMRRIVSCVIDIDFMICDAFHLQKITFIFIGSIFLLLQEWYIYSLKYIGIWNPYHKPVLYQQSNQYFDVLITPLSKLDCSGWV